jgi:hypothetical protein
MRRIQAFRFSEARYLQPFPRPEFQAPAIPEFFTEILNSLLCQFSKSMLRFPGKIPYFRADWILLERACIQQNDPSEKARQGIIMNCGRQLIPS